ncbi:hypothetical protein HS088_TW12G00510 [Tripterygium wilfordii]|uniref:Uncharacterized protein n=1 Tax=Tripterygium wilfordii TaxID=458696 RepID=A0A7J7CYX6_TRIWF|nr:hypothetical protein HS088_TW12G00510 [Tripterygium wilfordii]
MAGGHHGEGITYKGLTLHQPKRWHTVLDPLQGQARWSGSTGTHYKNEVDSIDGSFHALLRFE